MTKTITDSNSIRTSRLESENILVLSITQLKLKLHDRQRYKIRHMTTNSFVLNIAYFGGLNSEIPKVSAKVHIFFIVIVRLIIILGGGKLKVKTK